MAISEIIAPPPEKKGGFFGKLGKVLGTAAGAVGGAFVGQPLAGAALGNKVGGTIGGIADPEKMEQVNTVPSKMERSVMARPEIQVQMIEEAKPLIARESRFTPSESQKLIEDLTRAQEALKARLKI